MKQTQKKINSLVGPLYLVASEKNLLGVFWQPQPQPFTTAGDKENNRIFEKTQSQLEEYFKGQRKNLIFRWNPSAANFKKQVWRQLTKIPYGKTCSYKDIAKNLNAPKASRAVGTANGRNPLSIVIPCHRVISSDGSLGGYAGGLKVKEILLSLETKSSAQDRT